MSKRAALMDGLRTRALLVRAALSNPSVIKQFFNPVYLSNITAWREAFGDAVNKWGVYGDSFSEHPLVHRAVTVIHDSASSVPIQLSRGDGQDRTPLTSGPTFAVLNRPSSSLSRAQLIGATAALLKCPMGEAFWLIVRVGEARAIALLNPEAVEVEQKRGVITYRVMRDEGKVMLTEDQVIHFKTFNPRNPLRGLGALAVLRDRIVDDLDIQKHNRQMVRNGGIYRPILQTEQPLPEKGSPEDEALEEQMKKLLGSPESRGKVVILPSGLKLSAEAMRQGADMDYLESQQHNIKIISGATGVPPGYLGVYERDQADAEVQKLDLWDACIIPILRYMSDKLESDAWKIEGFARATDTGIRVGWDWDSVPVLVKRKQSLWSNDTQDVMNGIMTINEVRRRRGLPDVPWGDVWWASGLPSPISSEEPPAVPGLTDFGTNNPPPPPPPAKSAEVIKLPRPHIYRLHSDGVFVAASYQAMQLRFGVVAVRALRSVMNDQEAEVIAAIKSAKGIRAVPESRAIRDVTEVLFDVLGATEATKRAMRPSLREAQAAGGRQGLRMAKVSRTFSVDAEPAIAYLTRQENRFAKIASEDTYRALKQSLSDGLARGEGDSELVRRVQDVMGIRRSQAQAIAQTQVNGAVNGGVDLGFQQSEVVKRKGWLHGANPRPAHLKASGQIVNVGEDFIVGGEHLSHPGDPRGSDENIYNCNCTIYPVA